MSHPAALQIAPRPLSLRVARLTPRNVSPWTLAAIAFAVALVMAPFFFLGQPSGHDLDFHLGSWMDAAQQWRQGVFFPRWAAGANWGYGDARFIFYPPLTWCLGAALGSLLPWSAVPGALVVLFLVLGGFSMHRLAHPWLGPAGAAAAAALYVANPYHLVIVYLRSDFAELLVSALFPLAVHYVLRCSGVAPEGAGEAPDVWTNGAALALVYGAMWLANAPAAVIASYALALLLLFCAIARHSLRPFLHGGAAIALGLTLAAVYIVPAAIEQRWVNIAEVLSSGFRPEQNFLFTWTLDPDHNLFNLVVSTVAALEIALAGVGAVLSRGRAESGTVLWRIMLGLAIAAMALMFPVSGLLWRYAPKLQFVQFPWRWLLPLGVSLAFFLGQIFAASRDRLAVAALFAVIFVGAGAALVPHGFWDQGDVPMILAGVTSEQGYDGTDEYVPRGGDRYDLAPTAPRVVLSPAPDLPANRVVVSSWAPNRKAFAVDTPLPARAALHLFNYPAWQVRVNGQPVEAESDPDTGQMIVPLPSGHSRVELSFVRSSDRTAGAILSALAALSVVGIAVARRREP